MIIPNDLHNYQAKINGVVDGDTYIAVVDLGFGMSYSCRIRLLNCDTPELKGPTRQAGQAAANFVGEIFHKCGWKVIIKSHEFDNFGRCLASVWFQQNGRLIDLAQHLIDNGHAKPYIASMRDF